MRRFLLFCAQPKREDHVQPRMHTWLISAAASRTSFQLVLSNVRLGLWGCLFLEVMRLTFGILGSHIPEFDVTSITVSGLLVRIHLVFFPDVGRVISLQC